MAPMATRLSPSLPAMLRDTRNRVRHVVFTDELGADQQIAQPHSN